MRNKYEPSPTLDYILILSNQLTDLCCPSRMHSLNGENLFQKLYYNLSLLHTYIKTLAKYLVLCGEG